MENDDMDIAASPKLAPTDDTPTRGYIRVTPELEAAVIAYRTRFPLVDYTELGRMLDLPERTIRYVLADLPRLRATNGEVKAGNIKQRILWILDALPMNDVPELRRVLGRADTEHDIVHALHDLHKQGKVDFTEKGARKEPINIHLTARGRGEGLPKAVKDRIHEDFKDATPAVVGETAVGGDAVSSTEPTTEVTAEPTPDVGYPLLGALIEREAKRREQDGKAFKYLEAAEAIKDVDPDMYASLMSKADSTIPFPSPIESEFLRYAEAHPDTE
jgi:hypothetical protein